MRNNISLEMHLEQIHLLKQFFKPNDNKLKRYCEINQIKHTKKNIQNNFLINSFSKQLRYFH